MTHNDPSINAIESMNMNNGLKLNGVRIVLEAAKKEAASLALDLIKATPSWEACNAHVLYHAHVNRMMKPYVEWAVTAFPFHEATEQYLDALLEGAEYLEALLNDPSTNATE
jgi:hypothetical protein